MQLVAADGSEDVVTAVVTDVKEEEHDTADDGAAEILRSFPRPLMPLLEFLYREAKYSQRSLS